MPTIFVVYENKEPTVANTNKTLFFLIQYAHKLSSNPYKQ